MTPAGGRDTVLREDESAERRCRLDSHDSILRQSRPETGVESASSAIVKGHEMMIPLSSHRVRRNAQSSIRHTTGSSRIQYMNTALAYQLLPDDDGDGLRGGKM